MGVTNYHTINGRIVGQTKNGVRTHYVPDALGSVVATLDANGTVENTYRYKPYGSLLAKTGTGEDPRFLWVGNSGSQETGLLFSASYNRARHLDRRSGLWTTVDLLWPGTSAYLYAAASPTTHVDPTGLKVELERECRCYKCTPGDPTPHSVPPPYPIDPIINGICNLVNTCMADLACKARVAACIKRCNYDYYHNILPCFNDYCNKTTKNVKVSCGGGWYCLLPGTCANTSPGNPCRIDLCSRTDIEQCDPLRCGVRYSAKCEQPDCAGGGFGLDVTILHEMAHCCGLGSEFWGGNAGVGDCIATCVKHGGR